MHSAGRADPGEITVLVLGDPPWGGVFHRVMPPTQDRKIGCRCFATILCGDGVVDVGAVDRDAAAGEPAVLVAGGEEPALRSGGAVGVDGDDIPRDRVHGDLVPGGGARGEEPGGVSVDWPVPGQGCGSFSRSVQVCEVICGEVCPGEVRINPCCGGDDLDAGFHISGGGTLHRNLGGV